MDLESAFKDKPLYLVSLVLAIYIAGRGIRVFIDPEFAVTILSTIQVQSEIWALEFPYAIGSIVWPLVLAFVVTASTKLRLQTPLFYTSIIIHALSLAYVYYFVVNDALRLNNARDALFGNAATDEQRLFAAVTFFGLAVISLVASAVVFHKNYLPFRKTHNNAVN